MGNKIHTEPSPTRYTIDTSFIYTTLHKIITLYILVTGETAQHSKGPGPLDCLQTAARCYGTALKCSPRCLEAHMALGLVMEEFFYAEDLFGLKKEVQHHLQHCVKSSLVCTYMYMHMCLTTGS